MIKIIKDTKELSVKEIENEQVHITEIAEMISRKRDSRDGSKYREESILHILS